MGGGIGIPPMLELARELPASAEKQIIVGYRDNQLFLKEDLEENGTVYIATEDGSVGIEGQCHECHRRKCIAGRCDLRVRTDAHAPCDQKICGRKEIKAYISLEEHMACGVGACLGCVVKTKEVDHHSHVHNARICTDGPVFDAEGGRDLMNTQTTIAGVTFKNPVMTASGTFGSGMEYEEFVDLNRLGAVVTKGVANVPWPGNPTPRVAEVYGGMLNAIGLQNPGIDVFMERDIPFLKNMIRRSL